MIRNFSSYNPLQELSNLLPIWEVTYKDLQQVSEVLKKGGILCETYDEVMLSLTVLQDLGFISINTSEKGYNIIKNYE